MLKCVLVGIGVSFCYIFAVQEIRIDSMNRDCGGSGIDIEFFPLDDCDNLQTAIDLNIAIAVSC